MKLALSILAAVGAAFLAWWLWPAPPTPSTAARADAPSPAAQRARAQLDAARASGADEPAAERTESAPRTPPESAPAIAGVAPEDQQFSFQVVAAEDGRPLEGVEVRVKRQGPSLILNGSPLPGRPAGEPLMRTSAKGRFELPSHGHAYAELDLWTEGRTRLLARVEDGLETLGEERVLRMLRDAGIEGRIEGLAVDPAARVEAVCSARSLGAYGMQASDQFAWRTKVSVDGSFRLAGLPARAQFEFVIYQGAERLRVIEDEQPLKPGERREVLWRIAAAVPVSVRAVDLRGAPLPHLELILLSRENFRSQVIPENAPGGVARPTNSDGIAEFGALRPGGWAVGLPLREHVPVSGDLDPAVGLAPIALYFNVPAGVPELEVELVLPPAMAVAGTVRNPDGSPAAKVHVTGFSVANGAFRSGTTDAAGRFEFRGVPPGPARIQAWPMPNHQPPAAAPEAQFAEAGDSDVLIQLVEGGALKVFLVDGDSGRRVPGTVRYLSGGVMVETMGGGPPYSVWSLPVGSTPIVGVGRNGKLGALVDAPVSAESSAESVEVVLYPAGQVSVQLTSMTNARVEVWQRGACYQQKQGSLAAPLLLSSPTGEVLVRATPSDQEQLGRNGSLGDATRERRVTVGAGEVAEVEL